jgi:hypothetical protein
MKSGVSPWGRAPESLSLHGGNVNFKTKWIQLAVTSVALPGLIASGVLAISSPAGAAPDATAASSVTGGEKQVGMYVAGFDEAVAKANGYKIVTYANGDKQSVPIDPKSNLPKSPIFSAQSLTKSSLAPLKGATRTSPAGQETAELAANTDYNEVRGNCGVSWIRVGQSGTNKVSIASGFRNTPWPAYFWIWDVQLSDINGNSHQTHQGAAGGYEASRAWLNLNQYGYTYDFVYAGGATLINGTICLSGRPDVYITL